ncbi:hypothetical protein BURCENBC7_AP5455 [Burkholderia cenocepacia BC7]|nr:hypothetical protein BURCENK562V_C2492 [Burkholderia cenocepacia K56-2Valvano]ERI26797.1 hypothetical protein BURCENBC7_AP5455 [Burkholderia cenocepacia BC7]
MNFALLTFQSGQFASVKECGVHFVSTWLNCNVGAGVCFVFFLICREISI